MNFFKEINPDNHIVNLVKRGQFVFYTSSLEKLIYFFIFIFLARKFSVAEYGSIISVFVFGNILVSLFELGFANYFQRKIASGKENLSEEINSVLTFRFVSYLIILGSSFLYFPKDIISPMLVAIIVSAIFIFSTNWILIKIFYGLNQYRSVFNRFLISRIVLIIGVAALISLNVSLTIIMTSFLLSAILEFGLLFYQLLQMKLIEFKIDWRIGVLKRILIYSVPMGIGVFFVMVYDRIDILLIQKIISTEAVSFYAIAYSLYKIPSIFTPIVLTPLFTDLSSEFELSRKINLTKLKNISLLLFAFAVFSIIITYFLADVIISITYGYNYLASTDLLIMLVLALPFLFLNNLTGVTLNSIRKEGFVFYSTIIGASLNILLNVILLNMFGLMGAVITTIVSELLVFLIQFNYLMKLRTQIFK